MNSVENIVAKLRESAMHRINEDSDREAYEEFIKKCTSNATWKEADSLCKKYGYVLAPASYVSDGYIRLNIRESDANRYYPEIFFSHGSFGGDAQEFKIQTTAYGSLDLIEHNKFIEAVTSAHNLVAKLEKIDFTKLYSVDSEE